MQDEQTIETDSNQDDRQEKRSTADEAERDRQRPDVLCIEGRSLPGLRTSLGSGVF